MNDVAKKTDQYLTRYEDDPYAAFANEGGPGIQGKLLTCKKGEWCAGGDTVAPGTTYLAVDNKHDGLATWAAMTAEPTHGMLHTWQVRTGGGGLHVMFKNTPQIRSGKLDTGIDIRGVGAYIVGPQCPHKSGRRYEWLPQCSPGEKTKLIEPPEWLLCVIRARSHLGRPTSLQEWRKIAATRVLDGERNTTLLRLAGHLIANPLLDPFVARDILIGWNRGMCEPPLPDARVIEIVEGLCEREKQKEKWL